MFGSVPLGLVPWKDVGVVGDFRETSSYNAQRARVRVIARLTRPVAWGPEALVSCFRASLHHLPVFPRRGQWLEPGLADGHFLQEAVLWSLHLRRAPAVCPAWGWAPWRTLEKRMCLLAFVAPVAFGEEGFKQSLWTCGSKHL